MPPLRPARSLAVLPGSPVLDSALAILLPLQLYQLDCDMSGPWSGERQGAEADDDDSYDDDYDELIDVTKPGGKAG